MYCRLYIVLLLSFMTYNVCATNSIKECTPNTDGQIQILTLDRKKGKSQFTIDFFAPYDFNDIDNTLRIQNDNTTVILSPPEWNNYTTTALEDTEITHNLDVARFNYGWNRITLGVNSDSKFMVESQDGFKLLNVSLPIDVWEFNISGLFSVVNCSIRDHKYFKLERYVTKLPLMFDNAKTTIVSLYFNNTIQLSLMAGEEVLFVCQNSSTKTIYTTGRKEEENCEVNGSGHYEIDGLKLPGVNVSVGLPMLNKMYRYGPQDYVVADILMQRYDDSNEVTYVKCSSKSIQLRLNDNGPSGPRNVTTDPLDPEKRNLSIGMTFSLTILLTTITLFTIFYCINWKKARKICRYSFTGVMFEDYLLQKKSKLINIVLDDLYENEDDMVYRRKNSRCDECGQFENSKKNVEYESPYELPDFNYIPKITINVDSPYEIPDKMDTIILHKDSEGKRITRTLSLDNPYELPPQHSEYERPFFVDPVTVEIKRGASYKLKPKNKKKEVLKKLYSM